jgi:hypothetical protein
MNYQEQYKKDAEQVIQSQPEKLLESARITITNELKPPPPVIQVDNLTMKPITIMTKGNISVIQGKAKARKSFVVAILTAASLSDSWIYKKIRSVPRQLVVYFDTEQSSFYVQQAYYRIGSISQGNGINERFFCYALRPYNPAERLELIEWVFNNFKGLGFVVIDGIRDLIRDINSPDEATMITSKLLKWSEQSGAHILTVLHENKADGKARGHIGTELINKAETILKVEKLEEDKRVSKISCEMVRGLDFEDIYFSINNNLPEIINGYSEMEKPENLFES